ncbi:MAG: Tab2/Atab2 family RNA-binding protein [Synechococcales bacterium]|nr:Tab2/Atab2 family RNA-binding protein [Synechococcales bacterium]
MTIWEIDLYRRPLRDEAGQPLWELVICSRDRQVAAYAFCPQSDVNGRWVTEQLADLAAQTAQPKEIYVFRPQSLSLIETAGQSLGIAVVPTRRTPTLKAYLRDRLAFYRTLPQYTQEPYDPTQVEQLPPVPLPESLWGDRWQFGAIAAGDIEPFFREKPVPILDMPAVLLPMHLQIPSTLPIPGVIIEGGRQSMRLAQWVQAQRPVSLDYVPGEPDGLILAAGLCDRWVLATFDDADLVQPAQTYRQRQQESQGLHFLLIQPDDSGITYSGFWLLQTV